MAKKKENHSPAEKVGLGIGLTAAAVAAAGAYFLYGSKDANKNRKTVKSWMLKAKAEVLEQLEKAPVFFYYFFHKRGEGLGLKPCPVDAATVNSAELQNEACIEFPEFFVAGGLIQYITIP